MNFTVVIIEKENLPLRKDSEFSVKKVWKMLINKDMNKKYLREATGISSASVTKLSKGENITTEVLLKICVALDCTLENITETIKE